MGAVTPKNQPRQLPGMYLLGVPEQDHVSVPPVVEEGESTTVTAAPTDVASEVPVIVTTPEVSPTSAVAILPTAAIEHPDVRLVKALFDWKDSVTHVRAPLAAVMSSDTLARTV